MTATVTEISKPLSCKVQEITSSLRPGLWWVCKTIEGRAFYKIREIVFDSHWGLEVVGQCCLDEYIRVEEATFVRMVEDPPHGEEWSPALCVAIADGIVALEEQREGSRAALALTLDDDAEDDDPELDEAIGAPRALLCPPIRINR